MNALELNNLSKTYSGGKKAVDGVTLSLSPGEVFGFLGPNGAGKTTTVKLLNGMLSPTVGSCAVFGLDPSRDPEQIHTLAGVVTEHAQMYDTLTGLENLVFFGDIFGLEPKESRNRGQGLLKLLELDAAADQKLSAYSTGMRQRLSLARALIHRPRILFLDEPTSGLDPESAQNVHAMIRRLAQEEGAAVFLCTHQLRYAQEVCTRYGLMAEGRLLAEGTLEALGKKTGQGMAAEIEAQGAPAEFTQWQTGPGRFLAPVRSREDIPALARKIMEAGGDIYSISLRQLSLEDIYFALTSEKEAEQ